MATNKHALIRYKLLDKCFSNRWKKYFIEDLIQFCSEGLSEYEGVETKVSRRQLLLDIEFMRSEGGYRAPIVSMKDGRRVYYRYDPIDFSILTQPLNDAEQEQVRDVLETLGRIKGMPQLQWLNSVQTKLSSGLQLDLHSQPVISFEENEFLKGIEFLEPLYQFITHKCVLGIRYQGYRESIAKLHTIHPYYLKQYNNRWFLFGWNAAIGKLHTMALDRISQIDELNEMELRPCDIDFEEYFEDIIGVSHPGDRDVGEILLKFSEQRLPYILSKPIHGSQRLKDGCIELELKINRELLTLLLSYGKDVEVIQPNYLRQMVREELAATLENY